MAKEKIEMSGYLIVPHLEPETAIVTVNGKVIKTHVTIPMEPGVYSWSASANGYVTKTGQVTINERQNTGLRIDLVNT